MAPFVRFVVLTWLLPCCCVCAAGSVQYDIRFDATWSAGTHAGAYPAGAHFSPLWMTSHNQNVSFWQPGGAASDAIQQMAETGGTSLLNNEFSAALNAGDVHDLDIGSGISSPGDVTGRVFVATSHSRITVVTMVAPSPDWFVGVDSLNFWDTDHWIESLAVELHAYDAGTDSGTSFTSPNADTNPREPITLLGAPLAGTPPLGTFTFTLRPPLPGDTNGDDKVNIDDLGNVRNTFGTIGPPGGGQPGDTYPFDGVVDVDDLNAVRNNFGLTRAAVPEPTGLTLAAIAACCGLSRFRKRPKNSLQAAARAANV